MKEIDYENDIKKVYQQLHVDEHQVTVLKQRLEKEKRKSYFLPRKRISISGLISTGICYEQFQRVFPSCQPLFIEVIGNDGLTIHFK